MNSPERHITSDTETGRQDLGYIFCPQRYHHAPGYPRMDVVLRPTPTYRHFDPEWVEIEVVCRDGGLTSLIVRHPWRSRKQCYRVRPARVCWGDRKEKECAVFSFGGALQIASTQADTTCVITSAAPILYAANHSSIPMLLAEERAPGPNHRPAVEFAQFLKTERQIVENESRPRRIPPLDQLLEY
jgi:hypothetical protein